MAVVRHKEAIHSGHFMVSNFEAEEDDDDDEENIGVTVPEEEPVVDAVPIVVVEPTAKDQFQPLLSFLNTTSVPCPNNLIDVSLKKLFQCMSIAYRQKLTSPKWNRFRGMKLRWKDKIRLNNVIWRCWHMQFVKGHRKLVCAFANPLEIDNHNKTEAGAILEGKYWKRKLNTVTAEYKKWRIFYKHQHSEFDQIPVSQYPNDRFMDITNSLYQHGTKDDVDLETMITDADFFVDALFNSLGCPFHSNIEQLMDVDPIAPIEDWLTTKMPQVEEVVMDRAKSLTPEQDVFCPPAPGGGNAALPAISYQQPEPLHVNRFKHVTAAHTSVVVSSSSQSATKSDAFHQIGVKATLSVDLEKISVPSQAPKPVNGYSRGKLWSAAVRQAQETEMQQQQQLLQQQQLQQQQQLHQQQMQRKHQEELRLQQQRQQQLQQQQLLQHEERRPLQQQYNSLLSVQHASVIRGTSPATGLSHCMSGVEYPMTKALISGNQIGVIEHRPTPVIAFKPAAANSRLRQQPSADVPVLNLKVPKQEAAESYLSGEKETYRETSQLVQLLQEKRPVIGKPNRLERGGSGGGGLERGRGRHRSRSLPASQLEKGAPALSVPPLPSGAQPQPTAFSIGSSKSPSSADTKGEDLVVQAFEQKKRGPKNSFDVFRSMIPSLVANPSAKTSKAMVLMKGAEYINLLKSERESLSSDIASLRQSASVLHDEIKMLHAQLPCSSTAVQSAGGSRQQALFERHVANCSLQNWKYWVLYRIMRPLLLSYDETVSSNSWDDFSRTSASWLDQHASLIHLRPMVLNSLKELSVETALLTEPGRLSQEALADIANLSAKKEDTSPRSSGLEKN